MALPRDLASSKYELTLPSTGQKVEYRPFLVKEEKTLMIVQQTGKESDMIRAVQEIVSACTFGQVNSKGYASIRFGICILTTEIKISW